MSWSAGFKGVICTTRFHTGVPVNQKPFELTWVLLTAVSKLLHALHWSCWGWWWNGLIGGICPTDSAVVGVHGTIWECLLNSVDRWNPCNLGVSAVSFSWTASLLKHWRGLCEFHLNRQHLYELQGPGEEGFIFCLVLKWQLEQNWQSVCSSGSNIICCIKLYSN